MKKKLADYFVNNKVIITESNEIVEGNEEVKVSQQEKVKHVRKQTKDLKELIKDVDDEKLQKELLEKTDLILTPLPSVKNENK